MAPETSLKLKMSSRLLFRHFGMNPPPPRSPSAIQIISAAGDDQDDQLINKWTFTVLYLYLYVAL